MLTGILQHAIPPRARRRRNWCCPCRQSEALGVFVSFSSLAANLFVQDGQITFLTVSFRTSPPHTHPGGMPGPVPLISRKVGALPLLIDLSSLRSLRQGRKQGGPESQYKPTACWEAACGERYPGGGVEDQVACGLVGMESRPIRNGSSAAHESVGRGDGRYAHTSDKSRRLKCSWQ